MHGDYENTIENASGLIADAIILQERDLQERAAGLDVDVKELLREVGICVMTKLFVRLGEIVSSEAQSSGLKLNRSKCVPFSVVFGNVSVPSPYFWDPVTKCSSRPVQNELKLVARGRSEGVERALTDFGAEESFAQAAVRFQEHYGWEVGRTTVLRVVEGRASEAEAYVKQRLQQAEHSYSDMTTPGTAQILTELDGCEIRTGKLVPLKGRARTKIRKLPCRRREQAWRDVRVGFAGPVDSSEERTYVARVAPYPEIVRQLFAAACDQGLTEETKVVAVADGGNGLREELDAQFPGQQFILDQPHLKQHLYSAADAQGLVDESRRAWVEDHLQKIAAGNARAIIEKLERHKGRGKKRIKRLVKYLTRFSDAVHYDQYRKEGFPIGSGEVESCHRWIPQKRLKLPGAWWRIDVLNSMLALRVLRANGWWEDFWQAIPLESAA